MARAKKKTVQEQLADLGLKKELISIFLSSVHESFWEESIKLYKEWNVIRNSLDSEDSAYLLLKVDKKSYDVNLEIVDGKLVQFCNCSHRDETKACEHGGAVLLYKLLKDEDNLFKKLYSGEEKVSIFDAEEAKSGLSYFKELFPEMTPDAKQNMLYFNFEDFESDFQLMKVQKGIIRKDGSYGTPQKFFGKNFDFLKWDLSKKVRKVLNYMYEGDNFGMGYAASGFSKSKFYDVNTDLMMPVLKELYFEEQQIILGATFSEHEFSIVWDVKKKKDGKYTVDPIFVADGKRKSLLNMKLMEIGSTSLWVFDTEERKFYGHKEAENLEVIRSIIRFPKKLEFDENDLKEFFSKYYQQVVDVFQFNLSKELKREEKVVSPVAKLYLQKSGSNVKINLRFNYDSREVDYFSANKELVLIENDVIYDVHRDMEEEDRIVEELNDRGVVTHEELDEFTIENEIIDFVTISIPQLIESGIEVLGEENLFNFKVVKNRPKFNIDAKESTDWFNLKGRMKFGNDEVDMDKVLEAIFKNKRFVELGDGKQGVIPKDWYEGLKSYAGLIDIEDGNVKLSKQHVSIMNSLIELSENATMSAGVKKVLTKFKNFSKLEVAKLPKNLNATLRPYQKTGYDWLNFLREYNFNGILADDMGLGKTLQALTMIQKMKEEKVKNPFLIVVPTSLVYNWKNEIEKFTKGISVYIHHGNSRFASKKKFDEMLKTKDLVITTYGVLRNDLKLFVEHEFEYIVLDEAHVIKNPHSISAKAVYALNGKNKLVISGTPIQNNLTELWSLYHFLNPGYLGGYEFFRQHFVAPIEKGKDKTVAESLKKMINPFLLRRTKKVIADELPEKSEMVLRSNFVGSEKEIYETWKEFYRHEIKTSIKEKGINKSKMKILEGLMKLRQICLHPKMIDPKYEGSSGKFELLMLELEKTVNEGHKVLVFSSFVKMLKIVKDELDKRGMKYSYLDGKTKNRQDVVDNFQESEDSQAFLISIKAGGVGLNLTSADYVFILDPWWNPAVEMQAMDRAHRIGQNKKVFVYKMIAENTIEEKILKLQESKKKLVEDIIVEEEGLLKTIDVKEINEIFK